jgi:hypothetical protein
VSTQVLSKLDEGTLVVTTVRLVFVGRVKSVTIPLAKVLSIEPYMDAVCVFREGRENPDFFLTTTPGEVNFYVSYVMHDLASGGGS